MPFKKLYFSCLSVIRHFLIVLILMSGTIQMYAQSTQQDDNRVKVLFAKDFFITQEGENSIQKLVGQVELKQKNVRMYCDSAIIQNELLVWAYGNVVFWEGDSIKVFSNALEYNSDSSQAKLIGDIQLNKNKSKLFTDTLFYDLNKK